MVESTGLENRRTRKGIVSSNLTLSACGSFGTIIERAGSADRRQRAWLICCVVRISLDRWPSGLRRTPGKCVYVKAYREFESHPIRKNPNDLASLGFVLSVGRVWRLCPFCALVSLRGCTKAVAVVANAFAV